MTQKSSSIIDSRIWIDAKTVPKISPKVTDNRPIGLKIYPLWYNYKHHIEINKWFSWDY